MVMFMGFWCGSANLGFGSDPVSRSKSAGYSCQFPVKMPIDLVSTTYRSKLQTSEYYQGRWSYCRGVFPACLNSFNSGYCTQCLANAMNQPATNSDTRFLLWFIWVLVVSCFLASFDPTNPSAASHHVINKHVAHRLSKVEPNKIPPWHLALNPSQICFWRRCAH